MEKFNFLVGSYLGTIKAMFSPKLWLPFLLFAIVSALLAWLLVNPFLPVIGPFLAYLGKLITGSDMVVHYPDLYLTLPNTYAWITLVLSIIIEALLISTGMIMFAGYYRNEGVSFFGAMKVAGKKYFHVVAVWVFYSVVFLALVTLLPILFDPLIGGSPRRMLAFGVAMRLLGTVVLAMFMYVLPYVLIDSKRFGAAIVGSVKSFLHGMVTSYFIALLPYLIVIPFSVALSQSTTIVAKFAPETVLVVIILEIVANMIASFVFTSTVLRYYWEYAD
jgi:hypothetical protein